MLAARCQHQQKLPIMPQSCGGFVGVLVVGCWIDCFDSAWHFYRNPLNGFLTKLFWPEIYSRFNFAEILEIDFSPPSFFAIYQK
jgi:hypothetical protein